MCIRDRFSDKDDVYLKELKPLLEKRRQDETQKTVSIENKKVVVMASSGRTSGEVLGLVNKRRQVMAVDSSADPILDVVVITEKDQYNQKEISDLRRIVSVVVTYDELVQAFKVLEDSYFTQSKSMVNFNDYIDMNISVLLKDAVVMSRNDLINADFSYIDPPTMLSPIILWALNKAPRPRFLTFSETYQNYRNTIYKILTSA